MSHVDGVDDGVGYGVQGSSQKNAGVYGQSRDGFAVVGFSGNWAGLFCNSINDYAAILDGKVKITGNLEKAGGSFKIDHPLDPANKYLSHSFVESPDMKNVYDGVVVLDRKGKAEIDLPDWFGILNKDFRYQLTAIGAPGPNLHIAEKISDTTTSNKNNNSHFKIAGGNSGMEVSWQVTGIRKYVKTLGLMLTGFKLKKISLPSSVAIIYIQIFTVSQKRME
jgi:hypothetical protein